MRFRLHLVLAVFLFACNGNNGNEPGTDSAKSKNDSAKDSIARAEYRRFNPYDTTIRTDKWGVIYRELRKNDTLVKVEVFHSPDYDTTYYSDGCIELVEEKGQPGWGYEEQYKRYYHHHILQCDATIYSHDGFGGSVQSIDFYDSATGRRTENHYNKDYMPSDARDHLDLCGTITTTSFYPNGRYDSITSVDYHYEGLMYCPCGTWEYFDSTGKLLQTKKFKKCGDGHTDCVEDF